MENLTVEEKKAIDIINKIRVDFGLVLEVDENGIIIPKPPKP